MQINNQDHHMRYSRAWLSGRNTSPARMRPATGDYEELNVFGARIGKVEYVHEGEQLPSAPLGFTWRQVVEEDC